MLNSIIVAVVPIMGKMPGKILNTLPININAELPMKDLFLPIVSPKTPKRIWPSSIPRRRERVARAYVLLSISSTLLKI